MYIFDQFFCVWTFDCRILHLVLNKTHHYLSAIGTISHCRRKRFATHLLIRYHTADKHVYHQHRTRLSRFCAGGEPYRHWRRMRFALVMNISTGDERVENAHLNLSHTHTASFERLSNRIYVEMIASHSYIYLRKLALSATLRRAKRYQYIALNWSSRPNE